MDTELAGAIVPYVVAAVKAYGSSVLDKVHDGAADATARNLLSRLTGIGKVSEAVEELAEAPDDPDLVALFRVQLRKALAADPSLAADLAALLPAGPSASGERSVAVQHNSGIVHTGDGAQASQHRG